MRKGPKPTKWRNEVRAGFAPAAYPGVNGTVEYPERLAVGYRRYRRAGATPPAYWFGFGRAYGPAAFGYHRLRMTGATVHVEDSADRSTCRSFRSTILESVASRLRKFR